DATHVAPARVAARLPVAAGGAVGDLPDGAAPLPGRVGPGRGRPRLAAPRARPRQGDRLRHGAHEAGPPRRAAAAGGPLAVPAVPRDGRVRAATLGRAGLARRAQESVR